MYTLSEMVFKEGSGAAVHFSIQAIDEESLLVEFLSELVFFAELENIGIEKIKLIRDGFSLVAHGIGKQIQQRKKEIKAVTYHNLVINKTDTGYQTVIVFDV
jgi:SHS2 domain-containing protein